MTTVIIITCWILVLATLLTCRHGNDVARAAVRKIDGLTNYIEVPADNGTDVPTMTCINTAAVVSFAHCTDNKEGTCRLNLSDGYYVTVKLAYDDLKYLINCALNDVEPGSKESEPLRRKNDTKGH